MTASPMWGCHQTRHRAWYFCTTQTTNLRMGASRLDFEHVDLTPACHKVCTSHLDAHASLLNLTVKDIGTARLIERDRMIGVTCGTPHKYAGSREFSYAQVLAALFASGVDRVVHIGDMPSSQKDQICADIVASGQNASRIIFLPDTPSLATKFSRNRA